MAIFMLVPTEDVERFSARVVMKIKAPDRFYLPNECACLVRFDGSIKDLSELLNLDGAHGQEAPCPAVITLVETYSGYGPSALWDWLETKIKSEYLSRDHHR